MDPKNTVKVVEQPKPTVPVISSDLTETTIALMMLIEAHRAGPKSRERALIITKLQEALMWTREAFSLE